MIEFAIPALQIKDNLKRRRDEQRTASQVELKKVKTELQTAREQIVDIPALEAREDQLLRELHLPPKWEIANLPRIVQGPEVADLVVEYLRVVGRPRRWEDIYLALRGRVKAGGNDPAGSLLARYSNDPRLYRPRKGLYALVEWREKAVA